MFKNKIKGKENKVMSELLNFDESKTKIKISNIGNLDCKHSLSDWKNIFVGTIISLGVEHALSPETVKALWLILKDAFQFVVVFALHQ